jgi:hypothetical protein
MHAYATSSRKAKRSRPHHTIKMSHFVLFHSVTCYTNSIVSHILVITTKLRNITCILVATGVLLRSLECIYHLCTISMPNKNPSLLFLYYFHVCKCTRRVSYQGDHQWSQISSTQCNQLRKCQARSFVYKVLWTNTKHGVDYIL